MERELTQVSTTADDSFDGRVTHAPVLVTGASGWIASHVVYQLLAKGYKVRGTVRDLNSPKHQFLKTLHPNAITNLDLVQADLLSVDGWSEAVKDVEYIIHIASPFTLSFKDEDDLIKPAVQGTETVYKAALEHGRVKRIVHTSSVVAVVYGHDDERYANCPPNVLPSNEELTRRGKTVDEDFIKNARNKKLFDETEWSNVDRIHGYDKSKTLAERRAWQLIEEYNKNHSSAKIELTVINPTFVFGPLLAPNHVSTESTSHVLRLMNRKYPFVPDMESEHVDVRDVALAHIKGMELSSDKVAGKRFLLAEPAGRLHFSEQSKILNEHFGQFGFRAPEKTVPSFVLTMGKFFLQDVREAYDKLGKNVGVSTANAQEYLEFHKWRPVRDSFYAHALTLMKLGLLEKKGVPQDLIDSYEPYESSICAKASSTTAS